MSAEVTYFVHLAVGLPLLVYGSFRVLTYIHETDQRREIEHYRRESIRQEQQSHPVERRDWKTRSMNWRDE